MNSGQNVGGGKNGNYVHNAGSLGNKDSSALVQGQNVGQNHAIRLGRSMNQGETRNIIRINKRLLNANVISF